MKVKVHNCTLVEVSAQRTKTTANGITGDTLRHLRDGLSMYY